MNLHSNNDGTVMLMELDGGGSAIVQNTWDQKNSRINQTVKANPDKLGNVAAWDTDNLYPQKVVKELECNDILASVLDFKAKALYGGGLAYGPIKLNKKTGELGIKPTLIPEIEEFRRKSKIDRYLRESCEDRFTFYNNYTQFGLDFNRSKIDNLHSLDATECRLGLQNPSTGIIESCYLNANWADGGNDSNSIHLTALDQYYDIEGQMRDLGEHTYVLPSRTVSRGRKYYALPPWHGLLACGWLKIANEIPRLKLDLMTKAIHVKYHIQINYQYWKWKYEGWEEFKDKKKQEKMREEMQTFNDLHVKGGNNAIITAFDYDGMANKEIPGWKIDVIDAGTSSAQYLEDAQEAQSQICRAQGVPINLYSLSGGKNKTSGAGSDIRVSWNMFINTLKPDAANVLEPLEIVSAFNGWDKKYGGKHQKMGFKFINTHITTLEAGETSTAN